MAEVMSDIARKLDWEEVPIEDINPFPNNPKAHSANQIEFVADLIKTYGWTQPICLDKNYELIFGHCRLRAAKLLEEATVPCVFREDLTEAQVKALRIADNKSNESEWIEERLEIELVELQAMDIDLQDVGFSPEERHMTPQVEEDDFDVDGALEEEPITQTGDLWLLGKHRVLAGDSTKAEDVERLMDGKKADICLTSPPYFNQRPEYKTFDSYDEYNWFLSDILDTILKVSSANFILAWNTGDNQADCLPMIADQTVLIHGKMTYLDTIVWRKAGAVYSIPRSAHIRENNYYYPALCWEPVVIFRKGKMPKFDMEDVEQVSSWHQNVWDIAQVVGSQQRKIGHPAIFPITLAYRIIMSYSISESNVIDPFLGSGTTLIAADQLDRICYGLEIEPRYVDVTVKRYINHKGSDGDVYLERDGMKIPYSELMANV